MINVLAEIFVLGFLIGYVALLIGLAWWAWHSQERSGRRLSSLLGVLRGSGSLPPQSGSEKHEGAAEPKLASEK
jgi:hypothetical protein